MCSHSFLLADFTGSDCCSHFGVNHLMGAHKATTENPDAGSPPSAVMEYKMFPLKLSSMDFSRIRVRLLLLIENAIVQSRTGM